MIDTLKAQRNAQRFGRLGEIIFTAAAGLPVALWMLAMLFETDKHFQSSARIRDHLQDQFDLIAKELAGQASLLGLQQWRESFKKLVGGHIMLQYIAAKERVPLLSEITKLGAEVIIAQWNFVDHFAIDIQRLSNVGNPYSLAQVINRSQLYSGAGRGIWFRATEEDLEAGWIIDYVATDDAGTCLPCFAAQIEGPYLPNLGPYPGEVCLGRGRCRCFREPRVNNAIYAELFALSQDPANFQAT